MKREQFAEIITEHRKVLICGFPGTGKTSLALALAEGFSVGSSPAVIPPYVYYVNFKRVLNPESLKKGILQRGFLPTVLIFDDCQEKRELAIDLNYTLEHLFGEKPQVFCIFLFRTTLTREERKDEGSELRDLFDPDAVIDYTIDDSLFKEIAASLNPGIKGINTRAIFHLTGGDLFILDFILEKVEATGDIDAWKGEKGRRELYQKAIDTYFKGSRGYLGTVLGLLVLAQFDIGILPVYYDHIYGSISREPMKKILDELVATAGTPARCFFLHSSLAELLCRAAVQEQGADYINTVSRSTIEYLRHLVEAGVDTQEFNRFLANFIPGKLKLREEADEEKKIKIGFLQNPAVFAAVKDRFGQLFPNLIAGMLRLLEGQEAFFDYFAVLKERIETGQYLDTVIFFDNDKTVSLFRFLKEKDPGLFDQLKKTFNGEKLKILCGKENVNVQVIVNFLWNFFDKEDGERLEKVLEQLGDNDIEQIIARTIKEDRSISSLPLGLLKLKKKGLLVQWERKVQPGYYLRLIASNGTFVDFLNILQ